MSPRVLVLSCMPRVFGHHSRTRSQTLRMCRALGVFRYSKGTASAHGVNHETTLKDMRNCQSIRAQDNLRFDMTLRTPWEEDWK